MACLVIIFKTNGTLNKYLHAQLCNETMPTDGINSVPRREWNQIVHIVINVVGNVFKCELFCFEIPGPSSISQSFLGSSKIAISGSNQEIKCLFQAFIKSRGSVCLVLPEGTCATIQFIVSVLRCDNLADWFRLCSVYARFYHSGKCDEKITEKQRLYRDMSGQGHSLFLRYSQHSSTNMGRQLSCIRTFL